MLIGAFDDSSTSFDVGSIQGVDHTITCNPNGDHVLPEMIFRHSKGDLSDNLIQMGPSAFLALADKVLHFFYFFYICLGRWWFSGIIRVSEPWGSRVQWYPRCLRVPGSRVQGGGIFIFIFEPLKFLSFSSSFLEGVFGEAKPPSFSVRTPNRTCLPFYGAMCKPWWP